MPSRRILAAFVTSLLFIVAGFVYWRSATQRTSSNAIKSSPAPFEASPNHTDADEELYAARKVDVPALPNRFADVQSFSIGAPTSVAIGQGLASCFQGPDLSIIPDPWTDRAIWVEWKMAHPFPVILGQNGDVVKSVSQFTANFNAFSRQAMDEDAKLGKRTNEWRWLTTLKESASGINLSDFKDQVVQRLGPPTTIVRYSHRLDGIVLVGDRRETGFDASDLAKLEEPFSLLYEPPGWRQRGNDYPFRSLNLDFTADGRLYQWYFDPLPSSSDW